MKNFFLSVIITSISLLVLSFFLQGWIHFSDWKIALWVAFTIAILNALVRPFLVALTIPINFVTLGLFSFLINALILYLAKYVVSQYFADGIFIKNSFWTFFILAIFLSLLNNFFFSLIKKNSR